MGYPEKGSGTPPDIEKDQHDFSTGEVEEVTLKKSFNIWSTLGISYSITCTPLAIGTYLSLVLGVGGSPGFFFAYIFAVVFNLVVCLSIAELSAVFPHASGQIYWAAVLAPHGWTRGLSYVTGWLTAASYFFWTAGGCLITSQLFWSLAVVCNPTFVVQPWHYYLVYICAALFALMMNIPLFKIYPLFLKGLVIYINVGALFILIALLVRANPKQSASFVFAEFVNETGWSSNGVVFFLGLLPGATAVNGFDSAAHMAEEMEDPKRQVPQVMIGSAVLSAISGLIMILVYEFCNTKPENLLAPVGGQPISQLMLDCFNSQALTIIGILIFAFCLLAACCTMLTTFSRIWWSFGKEGGVPFSKAMSSVSTFWNLPVIAICFCCFLVIVIGTIELGSPLALTAILGTAIITIYMSYIIPIACSLFSKRQAMSAPHYMNLGKFGFVLNVIAVVWMMFAIVWLLFPLYLPLTGVTMNYSIAVLGGVVLVSTVNWFAYSRKRFEFDAGAHAVVL